MKTPLRADALFKKIYTDPSNPASFSSPLRLYNEAKKKNAKIKYKDAERWLQGQRDYTMYRRVQLTFKRRPVLVRSVNIQYQVDLMDMASHSRHNSGNRFLLTIIDCFSRFAMALPIKSKHAHHVVGALKKAFKFMGKPLKLQSDKGSEFYNATVKSFLRSNNVAHFSTQQEKQAQIVERFNRTVREKLTRYMAYNNTKRYIYMLPDWLFGYNNKKHSSLGPFSPSQVTKENVSQVREILYGEHFEKKAPRRKYKIGDKVRVAEYRQKFVRSHHQTFTTEKFEVSDALNTNPPTYRVKDLKGELVEGAFYEYQMQLVTS